MNKRMSVPLARSLVARELDITHKGLVMPAARTIVAQAEQIERLQDAINEIEGWDMGALALITNVGLILPSDMEPTG